MCTIIIQIEFSSFQESLLLVLMSMVFLYSIANYKIYRKNWLMYVCLLFWSCTILSTLGGYKSSLTANIIMLFQLLLMVVVAFFSWRRSNVIFLGLLISGLCLCLYVFYLYVTGNSVFFGISLAYGDGEEAGQVKALSTCVAVPAYYFLYNMIYTNRKWLFRFLNFILFSVCILVIILTYSRAVLLAVGLSLAFLMFCYGKERFSLKSLVSILCIISFLALGILNFVGNIDLDQDKMLSNLDTGNGRTEIWSFFISKMGEGGLPRYILGFGLGDSKRITEGSLYSGFYSHSVILDYFFSSGIIGLTFICYLIAKTASNLYKTDNVFYLGLLLMAFVMFFTHGTSTNYFFHTILGICIGVSLRNTVFSRQSLITKGS